MIGYHSVSVIADAWSKGIQTSEPQRFLKAMLETANRNEFGKVDFQKNGFISLNREPESVSKSLEYAYDNFCIAQFAKILGEDSISNTYYKSAFNFINLYDPNSGFFRARRSGLWFSPFQPDEVNFNYTEANAWQYASFAPHAIGVLNQLHQPLGGLGKHLDDMFNAPTVTSGREQVDITGLIGQYAHGNEPSHHMAYLYNYVGRPDQTQFYINKILKEQYHNAPDGLAGNEDCGQMSAWYVMSALGFYQISPGNPYYDFGRSIADSATLYLENGKKVDFKFINQSAENKYIQAIKFNGFNYPKNYFSHEDLMKGGIWSIEMGAYPSDSFKKSKSAPSLNEIPKDFIPVVSFTPDQRNFEEKTTIQIQLPLDQPNWQIQYKFSQNDDWNNYTEGLEVKKSIIIYSRVLDLSSKKTGNTVEAIFNKKEKIVELKLESSYANQYAAGGTDALIDGIEGETEYRTGDWQGFFDQDVKFNLLPTNPKNSYILEIGAIEDLKSWIFLPSDLKVEYSTNGVDFKTIDKKITVVTTKDYQPSNRTTIKQNIESNLPIQEIRVTLKNSGVCPPWHLGAGNPTWLFFDEVKLK
jgi:hypothetical protein